MSKGNDALLAAFRKGYRVNREGDTVWSPFRDEPMTLTDNNRGYLYFSTKMFKVTVHRFQAYEKYGDALFGDGVQVRHLDGNSKNNHWDNIAIGSQSQNMMDRSKDDRVRIASIASSKRKATFSPKKIADIKADREAGLTYTEIMDLHGISSKGTVSYILSKTAKHKALANR